MILFSSSLKFKRFTVKVINLEEKRNLFVLPLPGELVHGLDKLRQGNGSATVLVEYPKCPFNKKLLKNNFFQDLL